MAKMLNIPKRWLFMVGTTLVHILLTIATAYAIDRGLPHVDALRVSLQTAIYVSAAIFFSREAF